MNAREQAQKIYEFCVAKVKASKETLTYGQVLNALGYREGVSGQAIRYGLELVLIACGVYAMPGLTAIVVDQSTGDPTPDEIPGMSWKQEAEAAFRYADWLDIDEIDWDFVWENRKVLSEKHGTPGYWSNG